MDIGFRVSIIAADAITVMVTIYHTYGTIKAGREAGVQTTLSSTLLRAGRSPYHLGWLWMLIVFISGILYFRRVDMSFDCACNNRSFSVMLVMNCIEFIIGFVLVGDILVVLKDFLSLTNFRIKTTSSNSPGCKFTTRFPVTARMPINSPQIQLSPSLAFSLEPPGSFNSDN